MGYSDVVTHRQMLQDRVRTEAYERAINKIVKPGMRVLDFGCGTGVLSVFSAKAGAEVVYAVDRSPFIRAAQAIARDNGINNIEFYHVGGFEVELPGPVDVIVSEWMGYFVFAEEMHRPLLRLRDDYLRPAGAMIPESLELWVSLVSDRARFDELSFFRESPYGIDFSAIGDWSFLSVEVCEIGPAQLVDPPCRVAAFGMKKDVIPTSFVGSIRPVLEEPTEVHGLCGWFNATLAADVDLRTGPYDPPTHWKQMFFPFTEPIRICGGQEIRFTITPMNRQDDMKGWTWSVKTDRQQLVMDNFLSRVWLNRPLPEGRL